MKHGGMKDMDDMDDMDDMGRSTCGDTPHDDAQHQQNEVYHRTPNSRHGDQGIGAPDHPMYKPFPRN